MSELRYAVRTLLKHLGPTSVVVLTLGVGIGATTVVYSAIDAVQHFIPAVRQSGLLYAASTDSRVSQADTSGGSVVLRSWVSAGDLADWSARSSTFEEFAGFTFGSVTLTGVDVPKRVTAIAVTANLRELWGFAPVLGRVFPAVKKAAPERQPMLRCSRIVSGGVSFLPSPAVLGQRSAARGATHD